MIFISTVLACLLIGSGLSAVFVGSGMIVLERGWSMVISGSVVATGGVVLLGISMLIREMRQVPDRLERLLSENIAPSMVDQGDKVHSQSVKKDNISVSEHHFEGSAALPIAEKNLSGAEAEERTLLENKPLQVAKETAKGSYRNHVIKDSIDKDLPEDKIRASIESSSSKNHEKIIVSPSVSGATVSDRDVVQDAGLEEKHEKEINIRGKALINNVLSKKMGKEGTLAENKERTASGEINSKNIEKATTHTSGGTVVGTYRAGNNVYVMFDNGKIEVETAKGVFRFNSLESLKNYISSGEDPKLAGEQIDRLSEAPQKDIVEAKKD